MPSISADKAKRLTRAGWAVWFAGAGVLALSVGAAVFWNSLSRFNIAHLEPDTISAIWWSVSGMGVVLEGVDTMIVVALMFNQPPASTDN